jgi:hypothetical protein
LRSSTQNHRAGGRQHGSAVRAAASYASAVPLLVIFNRIGCNRQVPPLEVDCTDPVGVADEVSRYAQLRMARHLQVDLDVRAGTGTVLDGREVIGEFIVFTSEAS